MYIIFNSENKVIGSCDFEPNIEDLSSRNELCVKCDDVVNPFNTVLGKYNTVFEPAITPKKLTPTEKKEFLLKQRVIKLCQTDWMVTRHLDQNMLKIEQSLTPDEFNELLNYRQQLRDLPLHPDFPNCTIPEILF